MRHIKLKIDCLSICFNINTPINKAISSKKEQYIIENGWLKVNRNNMPIIIQSRLILKKFNLLK